MIRLALILLLTVLPFNFGPEGSAPENRGRPWPREWEGPDRQVGRDVAKRKFSGTLPSGLEIKGEIIGTTSNDYATFVVTDEGEIGWSGDGESWTVIDFNEAYRGYYEPVRFMGIAAGKASVAVAGVYEKTGAPAMFISSRGNVWTERSLVYSQGEETFELTEAPLAISADLERDEFVLTCTDGVLFFVPPCSHCNRKEYAGDD